MKKGICGTAVGYVEFGEGLQAGDQTPKFVWFAVQLARDLWGVHIKCVSSTVGKQISVLFITYYPLFTIHMFILFSILIELILLSSLF